MSRGSSKGEGGGGTLEKGRVWTLAVDWSMESIKARGKCGSLCLRHAVHRSSQASEECEAMEKRKPRESKRTEKKMEKGVIPSSVARS